MRVLYPWHRVPPGGTGDQNGQPGHHRGDWFGGFARAGRPTGPDRGARALRTRCPSGIGGPLVPLHGLADHHRGGGGARRTDGARSGRRCRHEGLVPGRHRRWKCPVRWRNSRCRVGWVCRRHGARRCSGGRPRRRWRVDGGSHPGRGTDGLRQGTGTAFNRRGRAAVGGARRRLGGAPGDLVDRARLPGNRCLVVRARRRTRHPAGQRRRLRRQGWSLR